ncbi:MAG: phage tail tape measure protein [Alphaproteobacteria bacterium]|nr:phage tail tape measure protein [Alphaproteobacteria bacterium]MDE2629586.1 phage tail tape measure protein [Alphaproteobacteria bacterium]
MTRRSSRGTPAGAAAFGALDGAAKALADFASGPVADATASIETAVTRSFAAVANTIAAAALSGKASIGQMVDAILADFDRVASSQFIARPIAGVVSSLIGSLLPLSGARAGGGPVDAGGAYLVGEQGPELFVPSSSGAIAPNAQAARPSITLNVQTPDARSFLKSETQIAAMMSRALARGQRNM